MIHEFNNLIEVITPLGNGYMSLLLDYGPYNNSLIMVILKDTGEVKFFETNQIKVIKNHTLNISI